MNGRGQSFSVLCWLSARRGRWLLGMGGGSGRRGRAELYLRCVCGREVRLGMRERRGDKGDDVIRLCLPGEE